MGRGGDQVASVLAIYADDPSSNPAEAPPLRPDPSSLVSPRYHSHHFNDTVNMYFGVCQSGKDSTIRLF